MTVSFTLAEIQECIADLKVQIDDLEEDIAFWQRLESIATHIPDEHMPPKEPEPEKEGAVDPVTSD